MRVHKLNNVEKAMGLLEKNNVSLNHWFTNKLLRFSQTCEL